LQKKKLCKTSEQCKRREEKRNRMWKDKNIKVKSKLNSIKLVCLFSCIVNLKKIDESWFKNSVSFVWREMKLLNNKIHL